MAAPRRRMKQGRFSAESREMSLRCRGPQASVTVIAASTASAFGRPSRLSSQRTNTDCAPRALKPASISSALASGRSAVSSARIAASAFTEVRSKLASVALFKPACEKASMRAPAARRARSTRRGPRMVRAAAITVLGELPASRAACAAASAGSPWRSIAAPSATLTSARSFSPPSSCTSAKQTFASSGWRAASSIETPYRLATCVFGSRREAPEASFIDCRGRTTPIR